MSGADGRLPTSAAAVLIAACDVRRGMGLADRRGAAPAGTDTARAAHYRGGALIGRIDNCKGVNDHDWPPIT